MPVFNKYNKKGILVGTVQEPLCEENLEQFIKEQGEEKAKIYLEALAEFNEHLKFCVFHPSSGVTRTTNICRKMSEKLFHDNKAILYFGENILKPSVDEPSNNLS